MPVCTTSNTFGTLWINDLSNSKKYQMQTDYLFNGIKGYSQFRRFSYLFTMKTKEATNRYKILKFLDKYGLSATMEAFEVSKRTLYRWKATLKRDKNEISSLNPKSTKPIHKRESKTPKVIIEEIGRLRREYPNIEKAKLHVILKRWCKDKDFIVVSESTMSRMQRQDENHIDNKVKKKTKETKNRKPKGLNTKPMS